MERNLQGRFSTLCASDFLTIGNVIDASSEKIGGLSNPGSNNYFRKSTPKFHYGNVNNICVSEQEIEDSVDFFMMDNQQSDDEEENNAEPLQSFPPAAAYNMLLDWHQYVDRAKGFAPLSQNHVDAIHLLQRLRKTKASLDTYETVMEWHLRSTGKIHMHASVTTSPEYISRKDLYKQLERRYNRDTNYRKTVEVVLPSSKARVKMVLYNTKKVIQSLLVNPNVSKKDYLFFNDNPFAPPPEDLDYVADLNTGRSYRETWKELIKHPERQILLPIVLYMDGATTGQFVDLELTPVKIALGIFTSKARDKAEFWKPLGYIPSVPKNKSLGKRLFAQSGHVDTALNDSDLLHDEGLINEKGEISKAQDLHTMLKIVLKGLLKVQNERIMWDLFYDGQLYEEVEFVPFIAFIKCDTSEADKLCGSYTSRNGNVAQLCRYCECPTDQSDDPLAKYPLKTPAKIQHLVDKGDEAGLRSLSQQYINNAFYDFRFGSHNNAGVHGATPLEMLHALLLGIYVYVRDIFFDVVGKDSKLAEEIDALCITYGDMLSRQSDRKLPVTRFSNGIRAGKLNAKRYTGILLCMLAVLKSGDGSRRLLTKRPAFRAHGYLENWIMLLETLLEWEAWLKSRKMQRRHVERAKKKHRYIMYLIKTISPRNTGMGLKVVKFHAIMHMADDILNFGVPRELDTGSNESHHKPSKQAALLTQKKKDVFEEQTSTRIDEVELLDLALAEIEGRAIWYYSRGHVGVGVEEEKEGARTRGRTAIGGTTYRVKADENGINTFTHVVKPKNPSYGRRMEQDLIDFVSGLQDAVNGYIPSLTMSSLYTRDGVIFRADVDHHGRIWRDWILVDWGSYGALPCKVYGYVDLSSLPPDLTGANRIRAGGLDNVAPGVYAIVESVVLSDEENNSDLMVAMTTEVSHIADGRVAKLRFYLADVEAILDTCIVVPDIGGPPNSYFWLKSPDDWANIFEAWLDAPHQNDVIEEEESEDEEEESEDEE